MSLAWEMGKKDKEDEHKRAFETVLQGCMECYIFKNSRELEVSKRLRTVDKSRKTIRHSIANRNSFAPGTDETTFEVSSSIRRRADDRIRSKGFKGRVQIRCYETRRHPRESL